MKKKIKRQRHLSYRTVVMLSFKKPELGKWISQKNSSQRNITQFKKILMRQIILKKIFKIKRIDFLVNRNSVSFTSQTSTLFSRAKSCKTIKTTSKSKKTVSLKKDQN